MDMISTKHDSNTAMDSSHNLEGAALITWVTPDSAEARSLVHSDLTLTLPKPSFTSAAVRNSGSLGDILRVHSTIVLFKANSRVLMDSKILASRATICNKATYRKDVHVAIVQDLRPEQDAFLCRSTNGKRKSLIFLNCYTIRGRNNIDITKLHPGANLLVDMVLHWAESEYTWLVLKTNHSKLVKQQKQSYDGSLENKGSNLWTESELTLANCSFGTTANGSLCVSYTSKKSTESTLDQHDEHMSPTPRQIDDVRHAHHVNDAHGSNIISHEITTDDSTKQIILAERFSDSSETPESRSGKNFDEWSTTNSKSDATKYQSGKTEIKTGTNQTRTFNYQTDALYEANSVSIDNSLLDLQNHDVVDTQSAHNKTITTRRRPIKEYGYNRLIGARELSRRRDASQCAEPSRNSSLKRKTRLSNRRNKQPAATIHKSLGTEEAYLLHHAAVPKFDNLNEVRLRPSIQTATDTSNILCLSKEIHCQIPESKDKEDITSVRGLKENGCVEISDARWNFVDSKSNSDDTLANSACNDRVLVGYSDYSQRDGASSNQSTKDISCESDLSYTRTVYKQNDKVTKKVHVCPYFTPNFYQKLTRQHSIHQNQGNEQISVQPNELDRSNSKSDQSNQLTSKVQLINVAQRTCETDLNNTEDRMIPNSRPTLLISLLNIVHSLSEGNESNSTEKCYKLEQTSSKYKEEENCRTEHSSPLLHVLGALLSDRLILRSIINRSRRFKAFVSQNEEAIVDSDISHLFDEILTCEPLLAVIVKNYSEN